jgi:hypothetical protein
MSSAALFDICWIHPRYQNLWTASAT